MFCFCKASSLTRRRVCQLPFIYIYSEHSVSRVSLYFDRSFLTVVDTSLWIQELRIFTYTLHYLQVTVESKSTSRYDRQSVCQSDQILFTVRQLRFCPCEAPLWRKGGSVICRIQNQQCKSSIYFLVDRFSRFLAEVMYILFTVWHIQYMADTRPLICDKFLNWDWD